MSISEHPASVVTAAGAADGSGASAAPAIATVIGRRKRLRHPRARRHEALLFWAFISPWVFGFVSLTAFPMLSSLWLSFTDWDSFSTPLFIGLDNYVMLLTDDPLFWQAVLHTAYFAVVSVPLGLLIALFLAQQLAKPLRGARIFRTIVYLPALVPIVAAAMIFKWLLAPDAGPVNQFLALLGIQGPAWLLEAGSVIPAVIMLALWQVGAGTILLIAALQGVPVELYEAARIDGASRTTQFWRISVPMVSPVLFFNFVTGTIVAFQTFSQVYVLTNGTSGPDNASLMMVPYLFTTAFRNYDMGYASALAWLLFLIILLLSLVIIRTSRKWVFYESDVDR